MTITLGRQAGAFASTLALTALGVAVAAPANAAADSDRIGGIDRYATSALISKATFAPEVEVAYLASGVTYPDALAGGAVAGRDGAPVLLIEQNSIPEVIKTELDRLNPGKIVILGGTNAISQSVVPVADAYTDGPVDRIGGENRYETAQLLASASFDAGVDVAFIASGENFPDALSGAAAAADLGGPVLLTRGASVPAETLLALNELNPDDIVILGGVNAVSDAVKTSLATYDSDIERLAGLDRFETSAVISADTFATADTVYIADGMKFPDALSGAPAAAGDAAPILLVRSDRVSQAVCDEVNRLNPENVIALGGPSAVSEAVLKQVSENCLAAPTVGATASVSVDGDYSVGDVVTYSVTVTNTSAVTLHDVAVNASVPGTYVLPTGTQAVMAPGASLTFTSEYTVAATDTTVNNNINVTGKAPNGATATSSTVTVTWTKTS